MTDNVVRFPAPRAGVPPLDVRHLQQLLRDSRAANDPTPAPWPTAQEPAPVADDAPLVGWVRRHQPGLVRAMILAAAVAAMPFVAALVSGAGQ